MIWASIILGNSLKLRLWHLLHITLGAALVWTSGCAWHTWSEHVPWREQFRSNFSTWNPEDQDVAQVDVATVLWRQGDPMPEKDLWAELDEQFISLERRKQFAQHGLRVGLMQAATGTRLQAVLADPKNCKQSKKEDLIQWMVNVGDKLTSAPKLAPHCIVDARRVTSRAQTELQWPLGTRIANGLLLTLDNQTCKAEYLEQIELHFAVQLRKLPDGMTQVRIVPVAKSAVEKQTELSDYFLDALKRGSTNKYEQRYEALTLEVNLSNDQYLVLSANRSEPPPVVTQPDVMTWGALAFLDSKNDQQMVLVIRGASVTANRLPDPPKKGQAWPLAWQALELNQISLSDGTK